MKNFKLFIVFLIITCSVGVYGMELKIFELNPQDTENVAEILKDFVSEKASFHADSKSGKIIINDSSENIKKLSQIYDSVVLKKGARQMMIEARIVEIGMNQDNDFGFEWELNRTFSVLDSNTTYGAGLDVNLPPSTYNTGGNLKLSTINADDFDTIINKMIERENISIISNPKLFLMDGKKSDILIGQRIPYKESITSDGKVSENTEFLEAGIKLNVEAEIVAGEESIIKLKISPEISSFAGWSPENGPIIDTIKANTEVLVKDNSVVAIGGLIKVDNTESFMKVPILGDLPLLGRAFQRRRKVKRRREIVIFLTPKIQKDLIQKDEPLNSDSPEKAPRDKSKEGIWMDVSGQLSDDDVF
ncbi:MAG: type II secretion system protein GspD [Candidatus Muiribacteriota bacterium]